MNLWLHPTLFQAQPTRRYRFRVHADAVQLDVYRRLGPAGRVQVAIELSEAVRVTAIAGIRCRHPDYSADEIEQELRRLLHGNNRR